jgi:pectate lyase
VVLRRLRIRPGDGTDDEDAIEFYDAERCIADHCSFGWGTDEVCSVVGLSDAITIQHCIISEGLNVKGHSMASIAGGERVTWHHNLIAHCRSRNPRFADVTNCDFRNNVVYDWGDTAAYGQFERLNFVGNFYQPGPSTTQRPPRFHIGDSMVPPASLFASGNVMSGHADATSDNWLAIAYDRGIQAKAPFAAPPVVTESAKAAFAHVLDYAGATLPRRDVIDARIVREVRGGTGRILKTAAEAGD